MTHSELQANSLAATLLPDGAIAKLLRHNRIRLRILPPLVLAIVLLQVMFMAILSRQQRREVERLTAQTAEQVSALLASELGFYAHHLETILEQVNQEEAVIAALQNQDRAALAAFAEPFFEALQTGHGHANYFEFYLRDRRSFLNVTQPAATGRDELSATVLNAAHAHETLSGLIQKRDGQTLIYSLSPILTPADLASDDLPTRIGYVEMGMPLTAVFHNMTEVLELDFVVAIKKSQLSRTQWTQHSAQEHHSEREDAATAPDEHSHGHSQPTETEHPPEETNAPAPKWEQFPGVVLTENHLGTLPPEMVTLLSRLNGETSETVPSIAYRQGEQAFQAVVLPLRDVAEQEIGYVVAVFETTPIVKASAWANHRSLALSTAVSVILVAVFYLYLGRVERDLRRSQELVLSTQAQLAEKNHALEASQRSLQAANLHLEDRVAERTEQLAEAKARAEQANRSKSRFLANMSHELRTPLNGIMGYAQVLQRSPEISAADKERISTIFRCGSYLLSLINDVLDLSKIEADKMELQPGEFNLPALLHSIVEMCRLQAEVKGLQLQYQFADEIPVGIYADEQRLRQILINLLSNAIKYTEQGVVTFAVGFASAEHLRFEIRDTGVGMTPEQIERIFSPFEQVSDYHHHETGSGLGLAISKRLVELMGSRIQVESQPEMGSRFWFDLSIQEARDWAQASRSSYQGQIVGIQGEPRKILVIDDKEANRALFVELLTPVGFEVQTTDNGWQGLSLVQQWRPDLVLVDLLMPGMDGFEVIRRIRQMQLKARLPLIATSASVFDHDQYQSFEAGSDEFLPKPIHAQELFRLLQKHLKLTWIYQATEEPTLAESGQQGSGKPSEVAAMRVPAPEVLQNLQELARRGNMREIIQQAQTLTVQNPDYCTFSETLIQLANRFRDDAILDLIHSQLESITS